MKYIFLIIFLLLSTSVKLQEIEMPKPEQPLERKLDVLNEELIQLKYEIEVYNSQRSIDRM